MKKHLSVLMLFARSSVWKLLAIYAVAAAVQCLLFLRALGVGGAMSIEELFQRGFTGIICAVAFLLQTAILCLTGCETGSRCGYTLRRLRVGEWSVFLWQAVYNICCYLIFWCFQLAVCWLLCMLYMRRGGGVQDVFLAGYRSSFLHSLLPLDETSRYVRNAALVFGMGLASAYFPFCRRCGAFPVGTVILTAAVPFLFPGEMGSLGGDVIAILLALFVSLTSVSGVRKRRAERDA